MSLRLKTENFTGANGKTYTLSCTFNTLADLEDAFGDIVKALTSKSIYKTARTALASMLNDYNEEHGDPERFTPASAGRLISPEAKICTETCRMILELIRDAVTGEHAAEDSEKN